LYHLLGALRSAAIPSPDPVAGALGIFSRSAQEVLAAGVASHSLPQLVGRLREAGELLRAVGESDDRMLISRRLLDVAHGLDGLRSATPPAPPAEPPIVPIASLEYEPDRDVVPIQSLGYEPDHDVVPIETLALETPEVAAGGLEASFRTFDLLIRQRASVPPALDALARTSVTPAHPAPVQPAAVALSPAPALPAEDSAVAIGTLCYRGQAALERALAVRHEIASALNRDASLESLQPLLQELLDLVPLALDHS
jgi:hypothetical protein